MSYISIFLTILFLIPIYNSIIHIFGSYLYLIILVLIMSEYFPGIGLMNFIGESISTALDQVPNPDQVPSP